MLRTRPAAKNQVKLSDLLQHAIDEGYEQYQGGGYFCPSAWKQVNFVNYKGQKNAIYGIDGPVCACAIGCMAHVAVRLGLVQPNDKMDASEVVNAAVGQSLFEMTYDNNLNRVFLGREIVRLNDLEQASLNTIVDWLRRNDN